MDTGLLILGICIILVLGAALPLLRDRGLPKAQPPRPETLRDWRNEQ